MTSRQKIACLAWSLLCHFHTEMPIKPILPTIKECYQIKTVDVEGASSITEYDYLKEKRKPYISKSKYPTSLSGYIVQYQSEGSDANIRCRRSNPPPSTATKINIRASSIVAFHFCIKEESCTNCKQRCGGVQWEGASQKSEALGEVSLSVSVTVKQKIGYSTAQWS